MVIVWKGLGIIVPILTVGIGLLMSLFYDDKRLGNPDLSGWTFLISAILLIPIGWLIAMPSEEENNATGKKFNFWRHTFFFLPILFWGALFLFLGIYLLFIYTPNPVFKYDPSKANVQTENVESSIWFYNPTKDSLEYILIDEKGEETSANLEGYRSAETPTKGEKDQCYLIGGKTLEGEVIMFIQPKDTKNYDKNKYKVVNEKGKNYYYRKIKAPTKATNDVDDIWVLLDEDYKAALIDVTQLYVNGKLSRDLISKGNWIEKVVKKYTGDDIIEVNIVHPEKDGTIDVIKPNTGLPEEITKKTKIYFLLDYLNDSDLTAKYITDEIVRLTTD